MMTRSPFQIRLWLTNSTTLTMRLSFLLIRCRFYRSQTKLSPLMLSWTTLEMASHSEYYI